MERRLNLLFGIIGGLFLALLSPSLKLYMGLNVMYIVRRFVPYIDFVVELFFGVLSVIGVLAMAYFSMLLVIDSIKLIRKKS